MKNIAVRALFGAIYVAIIVAGILCGEITLLMLLLLLGGLGVNEFLSMTRPGQSPENLLLRGMDCAGAFALIVGMSFNTRFVIIGLICWLLYLIVRACAQLWVREGNSIIFLSLSFMSQLYVALPIALMGLFAALYSPTLLLLLFILVWVNDTFAFLTGCTLGRHKLFERISPKKTWEGFVGGAVFTILAAVLASLFWKETFFNLDVWHMGLLGLVVTIAATLGDLVESLIKRTVGVKDSGHLIPGHGGILDRIDSLLVVVPAAFVTVSLLVIF